MSLFRHSIFVLLLSLIIVPGCVNTPEIPQDHFYRLPEIEKAASIELSSVKSIGVAQIKAEGLYRERSILYLTENNPLELKRYYYRHWANPPPDLVQQHLIQYLRAVFPQKKITRYLPGDSVDAVISGRLLRFERIIKNEAAGVLVSLELEYHPKNTVNHGDTLQNEYRMKSEMEGNEIQHSARQFGAALIHTYQKFLKDVLSSQTGYVMR